MPMIILTKFATRLDPAIRAKAMVFLEKLAADDTTPGLHVEPLVRAIDPRVRTGRLDQSHRAVMFRIDADNERHYVIHGFWPHDKAIDIANRLTLRVNPVNGLPQFEDSPEAPPPIPVYEHPTAPQPADNAAPSATGEPILVRLGFSTSDLIDRLGLSEDLAAAALAAPDEDAMLALAMTHDGCWQGMVLIELAAGTCVDDIASQLEFTTPTAPTNDDDELLISLKKPAAQSEFAFIEGQDELRRVIEGGDFGAWRVFLHPEQRRYVDASLTGPFRLSGGAGTGKTVVLVHRARHLSRTEPNARIIVTTFTTNLAELLRESLVQLDPQIRLAEGLGKPGVHVTGIDALAAAVLSSGRGSLGPAVQAVFGPVRAEIAGRTPSGRWRVVLDNAATVLGPDLANEAFLTAEYSTIVLPAKITTLDAYLKVRRPGRGVALDRGRRTGVWSLIEAYRAHNRIDGSIDFAEAAAVAAAFLAGSSPTSSADAGPGLAASIDTTRALADHVLVDEGQDLSPTHWQLLRAIVAPHGNDLFIAEDSHQRIYGPRTVLSRYGISIVGRSRRLTLNYRTTAQNLQYAMSVLEGGDYVDLENAPEEARYRSARTGPRPTITLTSTITEELDTTAAVLDRWLKEGTVPETIAVLVHDRFQRDRVVNGLGERGVPVRGIERDRVQAGKPVVMTMHRAKGTEFARVIIVGIGARTAAEADRLAAMDEAERTDAELRARSLVYVAASRARDELVVLQRA